jgi:hypothetical protein
MWDGINWEKGGGKYFAETQVTTDKMIYSAWIIYMTRFFFKLQIHSLKKILLPKVTTRG